MYRRTSYVTPFLALIKAHFVTINIIHHPTGGPLTWWQRCPVEMSKPSTPPMPPLPSTLLPPPKPLDTSGDAWLGWKNWKREFALFSTATQLSNQPEEVQAATLLITIGEEARKAYETFKFTTDEERNSVEVLIQKFEEYYKPATNLTFQEFRFGSRDQKEGEPFNEWLTELRILAKNCEFGELEDRMLRSRIILGVRDKSLQRKLLVENPTYEKTVELCRLQEQGQEKFREITGTAQGASETTINAVAAKKSPCSRCGYFTHRGETCPAKGKTCKKCGRLNHFAQVCKTPVLQQSANKPKKELRALHTESDEEFFLEALTVNWVETDKWSASVHIEGKPMACKLDTGANCCVISMQDAVKLSDKPRQECQVTLTAFFGNDDCSRESKIASFRKRQRARRTLLYRKTTCADHVERIRCRAPGTSVPGAECSSRELVPSRTTFCRSFQRPWAIERCRV
ncbi:uncharacterized protein LOC115316197 [Ixodes scapularis]|uniref:uncharacterized protein LOC115316197 n=1 Tax=Ixodes scapularis TaxID=6945 RepID=UPI001C38AF58|nr:uncharacterized protein LOC115316197 [Ixodes scapularis]